MTIPKNVEKKVVEQIFEDAQKMGWTNLTLTARTKMYNNWVNDPAVGGRLRESKSAEQARVWIKDGPMKEFSRARYGIGKYARYITEPALGRRELIRRALGEGWREESKSLGIKPLRITVSKEGELVRLTWAHADHFKHLLWAALQSGANGDTTAWLLCVVGSFEDPTPTDKRELFNRIAERCGLRVKYL